MLRQHGLYMEDVIVGQQPHYPLPDRTLLPWNGSYQEMEPDAVSRIYARCYKARLHEWQWHEYDEGRFFSRFDKFPYWCRDMLAFRVALRDRTRWIKRVNRIRSLLIRIVYHINRIIDETTWKIHEHIERWYLEDEDLPSSMRHLWSC